MPAHSFDILHHLALHIPLLGGLLTERNEQLFTVGGLEFLKSGWARMDLRFNTAAPFTKWVVNAGLLQEYFVLIDVGVQGGENVRWHLLEDHLVVHGFDAIREVTEELAQQNHHKPNRHYHWLAAGAVDEDREFYFNLADPCSSSLYKQGVDRFGVLENRRDELRTVKVRRLDTLFDEGKIPGADFIKCDVEGYERDVFLGAQHLLKFVLGVECETNFGISPYYMKSHYVTIQEILIEYNLRTCDLNFNRVPRSSFTRERSRRRAGAETMEHYGKPATLNVLFCRDFVAEMDEAQSYTKLSQRITTDQLIKSMIIYELYGLSDVAVDIAECFADTLATRMDVEKAIDRLIDISQDQYESMVPEIQELKNWVDAYKGQVDRLTHDLATAELKRAEVRDQLEWSQSQLAAAQTEIEKQQCEIELARVSHFKVISARALAAELRVRLHRRLKRTLDISRNWRAL
jgi:FkbM family methyltransferase